ncbi:unnamed protein product [Protopolystoma xenopodis]|uniref:Uncharacterized protein n=1 Tax=Protopolystoma xenopodis TaxID=117903 RepID=A0A448WPR7_9PLAT|nr:unnamed protein product [Protopolystoma xenopodis]
MMYTIHDAHKKGVTALASTSCCRRLVSGGGEGQVRVWDVSESRHIPGLTRASGERRGSHRTGGAAGDRMTETSSRFVTKLTATMKEHANAVSCIKISRDDKSCVSSSADGTCIVWCLE